MSLAQGLRARCPGVFAEADESALQALLEARLAAARGRWPRVQLDDDSFLEHLARHASPTLAGLESQNLEDLFLACACARGDRAALQELDGSLLSQVPRWIARIGGARADDVQQELRHKLLLGSTPHILAYRGHGALASWIRVAAHRCALDQLPSKELAAGDELEQLWSGPDPELDFIKLHDRDALRTVLHDALQALSARDRGLLRLHYVEGMSQDKLAALKRVHRVTVARWLASARADVLKRVRALLRERLQLSAKDGESLVRLLRSRLELSLQRALDRDETTSV